MRTIQANVLMNYPSGKYTVAFDTFSEDKSHIITICEVPCSGKEQAWAIADAYNYPEHNKNNWRETLSTPIPCEKVKIDLNHGEDNTWYF